MRTTSLPKEDRTTTFPNDFLVGVTKDKPTIISLPISSSSAIFSTSLKMNEPEESSLSDVSAEKNMTDNLNSSNLMSEAESDLEELVEEMHVFVSDEGHVSVSVPRDGDEGHVERLELLNDTIRDPILTNISQESRDSDSVPKPEVTETPINDDSNENKASDLLTSTAVVQSDKNNTDIQNEKISVSNNTVTVVQTDEGEGLDNLISVAEAFERSQQPDFNDIASPVVDGTDTERHLVRNCVICSKSLLGRNALGRHMKNVHPKVFGPYKCSYLGCGKLIESGVKMVSHMYHHTGGRAKISQEITPPTTVNDTENNVLNTSLPDLKPDLKNDLRESGKRQIFSCNAGLKTCTESFITARNFIQHMKNIHKMKPWYCEACDKRFMERQNLQFHLMSHGNKKNFACDICNKSFANPRQLYTHRALHLGKRYLCQECGYRARSSANLRGHVKAKHEAKQLVCNVCNKKFSSGNNLKNHMRIHTGESPYECELCGVKFKRVHHLHSHIESKMHIVMMDKCRRKGHQVPQHLDPLRRARGRPIVEDGPVTLASAGHPQLETHITEVSDDNWPLHQVVVVEENVGDFSIPVDQAQIEIIQEQNEDNPSSVLLV